MNFKKIFIIQIFFILFFINPSKCYYFTEDELSFQEKINFTKKICSYQGEPVINYKNRTITCKCKEGYKSANTDKKIFGFPLQCSYHLKKRSIAIFLSLLIPLGLDFFYLERYIIGSIILVFTVLSTIFILITSLNATQFKTNDDKTSDIIKQDKEYQKKVSLVNKMKTSSWVLFFAIIIYWVFDVIAQGFGFIRDSNNFLTNNDLNIKE